MLATGRCHTFDSKADGYLRKSCAYYSKMRPSNGAGPPCNTNDPMRRHFTALNASSQKDLLQQALQGTTVTSVEAHGTGTKLGDPIEYRRYLCWIEHVSGGKACLGHGEPNAGSCWFVGVRCSPYQV